MISAENQSTANGKKSCVWYAICADIRALTADLSREYMYIGTNFETCKGDFQ